MADCPGIEGKPEAIRQNLEEKEEEAEETSFLCHHIKLSGMSGTWFLFLSSVIFICIMCNLLNDVNNTMMAK